MPIPLRLLLADERVHCNAAGQVVPKLKTPWRACTQHLVMSPLELMPHLPALVPRSRRPATDSWRDGASNCVAAAN